MQEVEEEVSRLLSVDPKKRSPKGAGAGGGGGLGLTSLSSRVSTSKKRVTIAAGKGVGLPPKSTSTRRPGTALIRSPAAGFYRARRKDVEKPRWMV